MGEAQNESQNCFPETFYSARLLWKVLSQTKVIVSVLKAEKGVRRRVSVRTRRTRDWVDNNGYIPDEKANWEEKKNKRKVAKTSCYLCKSVPFSLPHTMVFSNKNKTPSKQHLEIYTPSPIFLRTTNPQIPILTGKHHISPHNTLSTAGSTSTINIFALL